MGDVPVQLGGGIRTLEAVEEALAQGVDRVILGTVALRTALERDPRTKGLPTVKGAL